MSAVDDTRGGIPIGYLTYLPAASTWRLAMGAAIAVRADHPSEDLRRFAQRCGDLEQVRRMLAIALILDGSSRGDAAKLAGVTLQIVRDWLLRFNTEGPEGLAKRKAPGHASILNEKQHVHLIDVIEAGPIPAAHGVVRWQLADLAQCVLDEFSVSVTRHTLIRELRAWVTAGRGMATLPISK